MTQNPNAELHFHQTPWEGVLGLRRGSLRTRRTLDAVGVRPEALFGGRLPKRFPAAFFAQQQPPGRLIDNSIVVQ